MGEKTITLTEEELNTRINEAVEQKTKDLVSKHNGEMATARKKIKDLENASLSKEEIEAQVRAEQDEATKKELTELRAYKKTTMLNERLAKEGLPSYFKNDSRLLNAEDGDLDKTIKEVKKEYEATLPRGNQHSSVVQTNNSQPNKSEKDVANEKMSEFLNNLL